MRSLPKTDFQYCNDCSAQQECALRPIGDENSAVSIGKLGSYAFDKGEDIPFKISEQPGFHVIRSGNVRIYFAEPTNKTLKISGPGDLLGFTHSCAADHRAEAMTYTETCFCPEHHISRLIESNPSVAKRLLKYFCREAWKANNRIAGLAHHSVKRRVLTILRELANDFGAPSPHGVKIDLKLSRSILGDMAGAINETLARVLTALEKEQVIVREKWDIHLKHDSVRQESPRR